ncbi:MAG: hypothetical protein L0229_22055, partial [Blastocatellia bacterium]|nr:hypothetical protein [Blastocatellia bacterium]
DWFTQWMDVRNSIPFYPNQLMDWFDAITNQEFFGYHWYDLPGNLDPIAQEEYRHISIITTGFDPEFCRNYRVDMPETFEGLEEANSEVAGFLESQFGNEQAAAFYENLSGYDKLVMINTLTALSQAGVELGKAEFLDFYWHENGSAFGIRLGNLGTGDLGDLDEFGGGWRSGPDVLTGSVEATPHYDEDGNIDYFDFDVDLYNPNSIAAPLHAFEVLGNTITGSATHPVDAARALQNRLGSVGGVSITCHH